MNKWPEALQIAAAIGAMAIGTLVYLLDRQPDSVYFIPNWISLADSHNTVFGQIGNHLPTFVHVYVFILLTFLVMSPSTVMVYPICFTWLTVDSLFELAQLTPIAHWIAGHVPTWFEGVPFLENTAAYFLAGTFDILDLISIAMGTVAAYLTNRCSNKGWKQYVSQAREI